MDPYSMSIYQIRHQLRRNFLLLVYCIKGNYPESTRPQPDHRYNAILSKLTGAKYTRVSCYYFIMDEVYEHIVMQSL